MNYLLKLVCAALLVSAACDGAPGSALPTGAGTVPGQWTIGPIIRGRNYSVGMPLHPRTCRGALFCIDFPIGPSAHVHYVTFRHGPLTGKRRIVLRYRIEADRGVRIVPRTAPGAPSMITPYFQRAGDTWSGKGRFEAYRWYASFATQSPIVPGSHEIVAPLDGPWTAVMASSARKVPAAFRGAIDEADQVGFVLGGGDGLGHGVWATGRARLVVTAFRVE